MTAAPGEQTRVGAAERVSGRDPRTSLEHLAMLLLLVVWAVPLTRAIGGRDPHQLLVFTTTAIAVAVVLRAWRVGWRTSTIASAVAGAALVVCAVSSTGWWGADVAASYVAAALTFVVTRAYATSPQRRRLVLAGVAIAGFLQFSDAFLPWWGSRDPSHQMTGTFYWHNPYAAFLLPAALVGAALVVEGARPWRWVGWFAAPASVAGIVFSTSRATLAAVVVGWLLVAALCPRSRAAAVRLGALTAVAVAVVVALPGPPLFPHWESPFAATAARTGTSGQSLEQNGFYRTEFWREAVTVAEHHPVAGAGFHSLATASALYTPAGWARSQLAHNGYLQPLTDGGLLLGVPFLLAAALVGWRTLRVLVLALLRRRRAVDPLTTGAAVAVAALMAHSAVDFDWSHPSVLIEAALVAACVCSVASRAAPVPAPVPPQRARVTAAVAAAALAVTAVVCVVSLHAWQRTAAATNSTLPASTRLAAAAAPFGDYRAALSVLETAQIRPDRVTDAEARQALALTARAAASNIHLALLRDAVSAGRGSGPAAVAAAEHLLARLHGSRAPYVLDLAGVLAAAGDRAGAARTLAADLRQQVRSGAAAPDGVQELSLLATVAPPGDYACIYPRLAALVRDPGRLASAPAPTASCRPGS